MTHTYATLAVPKEMFELVYARLRSAGYQHQLHDGAIDMHGIGLTVDQRGIDPAEPDYKALLKKLIDYIEDGTLVRNTYGDGQPDWAIKLVPFVKDLADAHRAVYPGMPF